MTPFEHVAALLSFVYALALTHLLVRIGELIVARERVRFSGLLAIAMATAIVEVFANWLSLWDLRSIKVWDLGSITIQFVFAVAVFLMAVFVTPRVPGEGAIDLDAAYWCQRLAFFTTAVAIGVLAVVANIDYLKLSNPAVFFQMNALVLIGLIPAIFGIVSRNRVLQYFAGAGFLAMNVAYVLIFCRELS